MWGATIYEKNKHAIARISIHAPMWGATQYKTYGYFQIVFQSTHPCGVRLLK